MWFLSHAWLIPALMATSFVLILFLGKRVLGPERAHWIGIPFVVVAFALSLLTAGAWLSHNGDTAHDQRSALTNVDPKCSELGRAAHAGSEQLDAFLTAGGASGHAAASESSAAPAAPEATGEAEHLSQPVERCLGWWTNGQGEAARTMTIGTLIDGQSVLLLVVVTLVSLLVHVYSLDYVNGDRRYTHYYAFLSLFTASMLFFVLAQSTLQMIVGWELVGLCSFGLIGHWWEEKPNSDAALKAFLTNRVGDIGLLVGMITLYFGAGQTFSILDINTKANTGQINHTLLLVSALCLIAAVMSKSGQFILHTWLPDAMAGPTPVSALIHAATMVVAGIYMVARLYPVFYNGLSIGGSSFNVLALVGATTGLLGALLGFVQSDIKKVLAYSTVSQLGFMVAALGVGAWTAALFHLFTHAFFKACLFLGAGSLSHACHHSFDMVEDMGGLRKIMPKTFATYVIAALSLAGFPLVTAGFWSKDEILAGTGGMNHANGSYTFVLIMLLLGAFCTAAYMTRTVWYAFFGEFRGHGHPHESGRRITIPLIILAVLAVVAGWFNLPAAFKSFLPESLLLRFEHAVEPVGVFFPGHAQGFTHAEFNPLLATIATVAGFAGIGLTWAFYNGKLKALEGLASRNKLAGLGKRILVNKYYLDWLYTDVIVGAIKGPIARASYWINQHVLDGAVNGAGRTAVAAGRVVYDKIDQRVVDGAVNATGTVADAAGQGLRGIQTGRIQQYAALFFAAAALLAGVLVVVIGG
jgi:NADH-quinone oxidoreductase subunit L